MNIYVFLILFSGLSSVFGKDDLDQENVLQFVLKELQSLRSRVSELENIIGNQNEIIVDQNIRINQLEKLTSIKHPGDKAVTKSKSMVDTAELMKQFSPVQSNKTRVGLNRITSAGHVNDNKRIRREAARILEVQPIAFYAYMSGTLNTPGGHHTLIFDTVKTNQGNGYHPHVGVFIVPKSGTYFFTWTMSLGQSSYHSTELVLNNVPNGAIYIHTNAGQRDSATGNLILTVNTGDEVFIRTRHDYNSGIILSDEYSRTDFSGFLIE
ncbi:complement C1q-like protein 3 [Saccostrea cucullata]|uniref:complement C1q-like protein 3 n=1 Tax=Saccostrea cuccullata TaxID=36930 RepID=UPI002ED1AC61